jgi:peptide/nickel transport system ATP-binding protein
MVTADEETRRARRGAYIGAVFQDPMASLNPSMRVGRQVAEAAGDEDASAARVHELLAATGIPEPEVKARCYPHELSGGLRQRVMIAMALLCEPELILADEPTTALDVTIQAQILHIMQELKDKLGTAVILITHDLGVVAETAQRVVVMYAGRKVEEAPVGDLFASPLHPYTRGLMASIPKLGGVLDDQRHRLAEIPGMVPSLRGMPAGCSFAPRCSFATARCHTTFPPLETVRPGHAVACWNWTTVMQDASPGTATPA